VEFAEPAPSHACTSLGLLPVVNREGMWLANAIPDVQMRYETAFRQ
jgi:hypothetical protein